MEKIIMNENTIVIDDRRIAPEVGFVYDERMLDHKCTWDQNHIEIPDRLERCYKICRSKGLIDRCRFLGSRLASEEEILLYHKAYLVEQFRGTVDKSEEDRIQFCQQFDDVYMNQSSFQAALLSAGCTIEAAEAVAKGYCKHAVALVRPPGHHAMESEPNGFCFFNNVVIAAKKLLRDEYARKIAIIDWDVHHGQGTQRAFYDSADVLYISIHRFEYGRFWPHLRESDVDYVGRGAGSGFNVNIPLNETGCGDLEYICIFLRVILPIVTEFKPELILVSAGYDAALGCPEGLMNVTPACYAHMTTLLTNICSVVCVLEGGYHLKSLELSVASTLSALLGDVCPALPPLEFESIRPSVKTAIDQLTSYLSEFWSCFNKDSVSASKNLILERKFIEIQIPKVFQCRNKYPLPNKDRISHFDAILDRLSNFNQVDRCKKVLLKNLTSDTDNTTLLKSIFMKIFDFRMKFPDHMMCNDRVARSHDFVWEITCQKDTCLIRESTRSLVIQMSDDDAGSTMLIQYESGGKVTNREFCENLANDTYLTILSIVYSFSPNSISLNLKLKRESPIIDWFDNLPKKRLILTLAHVGVKFSLNIIL